jgi:ethanolamine utilization microcompartment shell protein EutS
MIDSEGEISKSLKFAVNKNLLTLTPDKNWLKTAVYPVVVDPTVEIQVLNIHSQPVAGEYWNVDFTTVGTENLIITPVDQATVNDMQFATLTCGEEDRTSGAQILEGDIIFYPNWNCSEVATVSHLDLRTANHKLNFQFGDASAEAFNAAYVWDGGGGDAQWTTAANWSSDIVPGSSDTATFDNTCVTNCSPTIATTTTIAGLTMSAGYTGTLTQGNGYTFTVIGNFTMASGTFIGGSSTTTFTDYFTISGGTFVSASSTVFGPADGGGRIININSSQTFERLQFNNSVGNYSRTITSGDTLIVTGDLILSDGSLNTGTIDVRGNIYQSSTFDGGTTVLDFGNDSVNQTLSLSGGSGLIVRLNSAADATDTILFNTASSLFGVTTTPDFLGTIPISNAGNYAVTIGSGGSGSWEQAAGTYTQGNYTFTLSGSFTLSGGSFVGSNSTTTFTDYFTISGGTFVSASSTVFGPADGGGRIININSSQTFERLQFNNSVGNYSRTITSGDTLIVTGDLILSDGSLNTGTVEARGNVRILSGFDGGTTALTFGGSATQTFDLTGATGIFNGDITVNKSGGEVQLISALTLDAASQDLNIVEGTFNINGYNLTVNGSSGTLIVQDGGTFKLQGGETITTNSSYPELQSGSTAIYSTSSSVSIKDYYYKHLTLSGGGTYTATSSTLNIAGNFFNDASTFTHNNGTVNLNGVDQYIFGTSTFYNLTKSSTTAATLYFSATSTQTIANTLTLTGASGGVLSIRSTASGTQARIDSQATESISYLDVKDSYNINASDINAQSTYSTDSGNNEGWIFEAVISQGDYRFYENINQLQPTVDIGALNSSVIIISTSSPIRLRMNLLVSDYNLSTTTSNFKLQVSSYTNSNWNDVSINPDEWYDHSWLNRRKIIFNNSSATENLTDFPVLVNLNESSNIDYSKTQNSGQDIRFVDSDGSTLLNYEIEKWDETSTSTVWVKVPQISSASSTDYIWMYYNNPGATDNSTTTGVWDSSFRFVHHLNDTTATTTIDDSTSNNIIGTKLSTTEPNATSTELSDGAQYFDSSNDRVIINDATDPTAYTI